VCRVREGTAKHLDTADHDYERRNAVVKPNHRVHHNVPTSHIITNNISTGNNTFPSMLIA